MMSIWVIIGEFKLPAGIYLLKISNETPEQCVKYVQI